MKFDAIFRISEGGNGNIAIEAASAETAAPRNLLGKCWMPRLAGTQVERGLRSISGSAFQ